MIEIILELFLQSLLHTVCTIKWSTLSNYNALLICNTNVRTVIPSLDEGNHHHRRLWHIQVSAVA